MILICSGAHPPYLVGTKTFWPKGIHIVRPIILPMVNIDKNKRILEPFGLELCYGFRVARRG